MVASVIRCLHCHLNQFKTESGNCRKCHLPFCPVQKPVIYMQSAPVPSSGYSDLFQRFALSLKLIRLSKRLSQRELGLAAHVPRTRISRIENNRVNVRGLLWTSMVKLFSGLDVSPYTFFLLVDALNA